MAKLILKKQQPFDKSKLIKQTPKDKQAHKDA